MIAHQELHRWAIETLLPKQVPEVAIRRSASALYYGFFHRLCAEGALVFGDGGPAAERQVAQAFRHGHMRQVCRKYVAWLSKPFEPPLDIFVGTTPDQRLIGVAAAFELLLEARHSADYDLAVPFDRAFGLELLEIAEFAHWKLDELHGTALLRIFLSALILNDRSGRRG